MNKIIFYVLLILVYLGLAKSFSPAEIGISYITSRQELAKLTNLDNASIVLVNAQSTGFFLKTHYHKYKIVSPDTKQAEEIIVRTSKHYFDETKEFIGLSLFNRDQKLEDYTPVPPGIIFVNNKDYGFWKKNKDGVHTWKFYTYVRHIARQLGWGNFRPTKEFHVKSSIHISQHKVFFGLNNEFGSNGSVTRENFKDFFEQKQKETPSLKKLMLEYLKENFYNKI